MLIKNVMLPGGIRPQPYQVAGVYMLFRGLELRYIGRSVHIFRRLQDHHRTTKDWDSYRILPCADSIAAAHLENTLIGKHKPPLNCEPRTRNVALR